MSTCTKPGKHHWNTESNSKTVDIAFALSQVSRPADAECHVGLQTVVCHSQLTALLDNVI